MKKRGFLNPEDIRTLIDDNTDEHAPHFTFMTTHGTILGHDNSQNVKTARKFGAFAGTTWLRHSKSIADTEGEASPEPEPDFGLNGKTLKVIIDQKGKKMQGMIVMIDGMVSAITYVKGETLLAAQMERSGFVGEGDEVAVMILEDEPLNHPFASNREESLEADNEHDDLSDGENSRNSKGKEKDDITINSSISQSDEKLSKIRILEIRAETMAKVFAGEICGPEFRMPPDFK
ncbi:hypothetical protein ACLMJK_008008 [Lecanora helva]